MTNAITIPDRAIASVTSLANLVRDLASNVFVEGLDFGTIPGTDKPTLLQPGMEKLMRAMNAVPQYRELHVTRDYDRPLFHFEYECTLIDAEGGTPIPGGRAIGLATSMESKWRWRTADRTCPNCGKATIKRSKYPPKGAPKTADPGWYCYQKIGGCGAEFSAADPAITSQSLGRVENPDIFDQINTISKIAQKRALASAVKGAANVSELYTVDLDTYEPFPEYVGKRGLDEATGEIVEGTAVVVTKPAPEPPPMPDGNPFAGLPEIEAPAEQPAKSKPEFSNQQRVIEWVRGWNNQNVVSDDLLAALGVTRFRDYPGTIANANQTVTEFLIAKGRAS